MRSIIITNMLFLSTNTLHFRERISLIKMRFFQRNYAILPTIYHLILNIKAAMCTKGHTNY